MRRGQRLANCVSMAFGLLICLFELPVLRLLYGCIAGWSFAAGEYLVGAGPLQARGASLSSVPVN